MLKSTRLTCDLQQSSNSTAFSSLWKCLRSVRRYASCGLIFSRNRDFNVVNKEELSLESDETGMNATTYPMTPSVWRARTRSGSSSSQGDRSASSSRQASPVTGARKQPRRLPGLQASQENVVIPPQNQVEELRKSFYEQLTQRLQHVSAQLQSQTSAGALGSILGFDVAFLTKDVYDAYSIQVEASAGYLLLQRPTRSSKWSVAFVSLLLPISF